MRFLGRKNAARRALGAAIMEYVILAVGIGVLVTFAVILFGRTANEQIQGATDVLGGKQGAGENIEVTTESSEADTSTENLGQK